ncbi:MAG: hypothetical protein ACI9VR_001187, partial [Cognaticolwellia sp.]
MLHGGIADLQQQRKCMEYRGLTLDAFQEQAITALRDGQSV